MNIVATVKGLFYRAVSKRTVSKKQLITSYVSLFIVFAVLLTATFSWFTVKDTATIDASTFTLSASSGLRVNQGEDISGQVRLATDVTLAEASSVDGRNIYFPTTGTFSSTTSEMTFRDGNVGDKNKLYYYNDFSLNSDSGKTDVYVKGYEVKVTTTNNKTYTYDGTENQSTTKCPIRIAFIKDSADADSIKVIDPTALLKEYSTTYKSVSSTDSTGSPVVAESASTSFMQYYYGNDPLFTLGDSGDLDMTMVIWLEGGDTSSGTNNCDEFAGATVSLNIQLESNWDYMEEVKFIDDTVGDDDKSVTHWVTLGDCIVTMSYVDTDGNTKYVEMSQSSNYSSDYTWTAYIPQAVVTDITFNRYSTTAQVVYNAWYTTTNYSGGGYTDRVVADRYVTYNGNTYRGVVYRATGGNGSGTAESARKYPCKGYWEYSSDAELVGGDTENTTVASTTSATQTTTSAVSGDISINTTLTDQTSSSWVYTNVVSYGCKLYIVFDNGVSMEVTASAYGKFTGSNLSVDSTAKIKGFELKNSSGVTTNTFYLSSDSYVSIQNGWWYNFYINQDDQLVVQ